MEQEKPGEIAHISTVIIAVLLSFSGTVSHSSPSLSNIGAKGSKVGMGQEKAGKISHISTVIIAVLPSSLAQWVTHPLA